MMTYNFNGENVIAKGSTYLTEDKIKENPTTSTESEEESEEDSEEEKEQTTEYTTTSTESEEESEEEQEPITQYTTTRKSTTRKSTANSPALTTPKGPMIEIKTATTQWADSDGDFRYKFKSSDGSCTIDILDNPGDDMAKGAIDRYTGDQLGSCADFEDDITSVVITHTRGDGWMGEYLKMYRDDKVFICPLGKWVETASPKVEFPCSQ